MTTHHKVIEDFIEMYESQPCLWQVQSKEYHNRKMKHAAYKKLVAILKLIDPQADRERVVRKINNLRSNYRKELKKVVASEKSAVQNMYVPSLWYFDRLQFLSDHEKVRNNVTDSEGEGPDEEIIRVKIEPSTGSQTISSPASPTDAKSSTSRPTTPQPPDKKSKNDLANEALISLNEHLKRPQERKQDDRFDIFGKNVAAKLRDIDNKTQRILAEKIINDALFEAEMGTLTPQHRLTNNKPPNCGAHF